MNVGELIEHLSTIPAETHIKRWNEIDGVFEDCIWGEHICEPTPAQETPTLIIL
jgi:hypothetical protein